MGFLEREHERRSLIRSESGTLKNRFKTSSPNQKITVPKKPKKPNAYMVKNSLNSPKSRGKRHTIKSSLDRKPIIAKGRIISN